MRPKNNKKTMNKAVRSRILALVLVLTVFVSHMSPVLPVLVKGNVVPSGDSGYSMEEWMEQNTYDSEHRELDVVPDSVEGTAVSYRPPVTSNVKTNPIPQTSQTTVSSAYRERPVSAQPAKDEPSIVYSDDELVLTGEANGITVIVQAERDAFPGNVYMQVSPVETDLSDVVGDTVGESASYTAVDISFFDADLDTEIEPAKPIRVNMVSTDMLSADDAAVVHLDDQGGATVVDNTDLKSDTVSFSSGEFSVYILVKKVIEKTVLASDGNSYKVTVTCLPETGITSAADLLVEEILPGDERFAGYVSESASVLDINEKNVTYSRFFDITIVDENGEELQPASGTSVDVKIELEDAKDDLQVIHFGSDGTELIEAGNEETGISFKADGFSVYGFVDYETIEEQILTASGETLSVSVKVTDPEDIARFYGLRVAELGTDSDAYWDAFEAVADTRESLRRTEFFAVDISLLDENGNEFEPAGDVNVKMGFVSLPADEDVLVSSMEVQHLTEADGDLVVQTVATSDDVTKVGGTVTTEFTVDSFSTFTLTWTGDAGEAAIISDDDATSVMSLQNEGQTYATVKVHFVDSEGNNIESPLGNSIAANAPYGTAVSIEDTGIISEIDGYDFTGAFLGSPDGKEVASFISGNESSETQDYVEEGSTGDSGRPNNWSPSTNGVYYGDVGGRKARIYYRYVKNNWRFMTSETDTNNSYRYTNGTVYTYGTVHTNETTITFTDGEKEEVLESGSITGIWNDAADIYLVYEPVGSTEIKHATIHFGMLDTGGTFSDLNAASNLDTSATAISVSKAIPGYTFVAAYYSDSSAAHPATDGTQIDPVLRSIDDGWQYKETNTSGTGFVKDGSHIYVTYMEKADPVPTPASGDIPAPTTIKHVTSNNDGTYDIQLDIIGKSIVETEEKKANVLLIFDRTSSMDGSMANAPGNGQRIDAAKAAVHTLITALDPANNPVNMAVFSFARFADDPYKGSNNSFWTTSGSAITGYTDALTLAASGAGGGLNGGTNWEDAFYQARSVLGTLSEDDAKNPTYIIFLTDGNPSIHRGNMNDNGGITNPANANSDCYTRAVTEAEKLSKSYKIYGVLCANQSDGPLLQTLVNTLNNGGYNAEHILANDSTTLTNKFKDIADYIVSQLGASGVATNDQMTALSTVNASVSGAAGAFRYYKAHEVTLKNGKYYYLDGDGKDVEVPENQVQTYSYVDGNGNEVSYLYYNRVTWAAPGASYDPSSGVTWDLSSEGSLAAGSIYSVRFTVWPSQEAYDLIANLNNGTVDYDSLSQSVKDQVYEAGGVYYLRTNTTLTTEYEFKGNTYTDDIPFHQGSMDLASTEMDVRKAFAHDINAQDPLVKIEFYLLVDGKYYQKDGTTSETLTENVHKLPVSADSGWKNSVYIAPGVIKDGQILEFGHKYSLDEKVIQGSAYEYELTSQTVRPMMVNAQLKYFALVDKYNPAPEGAKTYFFDNQTRTFREATNSDTGEVYYELSLNNGKGELVGTNRKTAELDITKWIIDNTGNLSDDQLDAETFTYRVTFTVPAGSDISGITAYEYVARYNDQPASNRYTIFGYQESEQTEQDQSRTGIAADVERFSGKIYGGYTVTTSTTNRQMADMFRTNPDGTMSATIDITLKRKEIIRFTNLPSDTQYTITEMYNNYRQADPSRDADAAGSTMDSNLAAQGYTTSFETKSRNSVTGDVRTGSDNGTTIRGTIDYLDSRYYNRFTNTLNNVVDVEIKGTKHLDGYEWSGESYFFNLLNKNGEFTLIPDEDGTYPDQHVYNPGPMITGRTRFYLKATEGSADKTYTFGRFRFNKAGEYVYIVKEDNAGTVQQVNGKYVEFGGPETIRIKIAADSTGKLYVEKVESVTGSNNVTWDADKRIVNVTITNKAPKTEIKLKKVSTDGAILGGAEFSLSKYQNNEWVAVQTDPYSPGSTAETNPVSLGNLTTGRYRIKEETVPAGYNPPAEDTFFEVYVDEVGEVLTTKARYTDEGGTAPGDELAKDVDGTYLITIVNEPGAVLPEAGGSGAEIFKLVGSALMLISAMTFMIRRKKRA